tara:strand:+ start:26 stop:1018 length:993 start_codon:yes stop_codon:yes gene_type:complete
MDSIPQYIESKDRIEKSTFEKIMKGNEYYLKQVQNAIKNNIGVSLPFSSEIENHIIVSEKISTRVLVLLNSASLFKEPDQAIFDIGSTLELLNTASNLHHQIKTTEKARRLHKHYKNIWGNEVSVLLGDYLLSLSFQILARLGNLDVLECISLATKNISHGQVLEISEPPHSVTIKDWRRVIRGKFAGLFGAAAQCAAYWGNADNLTASILFSFGEHVGMAVQLKTDLNELGNKNLVKEKIKNNVLWSPICFLIHKCMPENQRLEISQKLQNEFEDPETLNEILILIKQHDLTSMIKYEAENELKLAKECLLNLEIDTSPLLKLSQFSVI